MKLERGIAGLPAVKSPMIWSGGSDSWDERVLKVDGMVTERTAERAV
jgi:hypothetical protein